VSSSFIYLGPLPNPYLCRGFIERYRTCKTGAEVQAMQDKIIAELESDYDTQRRQGVSYAFYCLLATSHFKQPEKTKTMTSLCLTRIISACPWTQIPMALKTFRVMQVRRKRLPMPSGIRFWLRGLVRRKDVTASSSLFVQYRKEIICYGLNCIRGFRIFLHHRCWQAYGIESQFEPFVTCCNAA
jgi:hypothetical protein